MLWLSEDDGDPPWWMWVIMVVLTAGSVALYGYVSQHFLGHFRQHRVLLELCRLPLLACIYWFAARLWCWFDKS